jgi:hypothetical protein
VPEIFCANMLKEQVRSRKYVRRERIGERRKEK